MNSQDREQVRLSLLRHLDAAAGRRFGLGSAVLLQHLRSEGYEVTIGDVVAELAYLRDKGGVANDPKPISPENATWRITAQGRDEFARYGE